MQKVTLLFMSLFICLSSLAQDLNDAKTAKNLAEAGGGVVAFGSGASALTIRSEQLKLEERIKKLKEELDIDIRAREGIVTTDGYKRQLRSVEVLNALRSRNGNRVEQQMYPMTETGEWVRNKDSQILRKHLELVKMNERVRWLKTGKKAAIVGAAVGAAAAVAIKYGTANKSTAPVLHVVESPEEAVSQ